MKLEPNYLGKLSDYAGYLAKMYDNTSFSDENRDNFTGYMRDLKESPELFVKTRWKNAEGSDLLELASDMHNAVKSCEDTHHCSSMLKILSEAAHQEAVKLQCKAIENMCPQGTGAAAADAIRTRGGLLRPLA